MPQLNTDILAGAVARQWHYR